MILLDDRHRIRGLNRYGFRPDIEYIRISLEGAAEEVLPGIIDDEV